MTFRPALLAFLFLTFAVHAHAACTGQDYYISATGNDSASGTTPAAPWTVGKASTFKFPASACINLLTDAAASVVLDGANISGPITWDGGGHTLTATTSGAGSNGVLLNNLAGCVDFRRTAVRPSPTGNTQYGINTQGSTCGIVQMNDVRGFTLADGNNDASVDIIAGGRNLTVTNNIVSGLPGNNFRDDHGIRIVGYTGDITVSWNTVTQIEGRSAAQGAGGGYSGNGIGIGWPLAPCDQNAKCSISVQHNDVNHTGGNTDMCGGPSNILGYQVVSKLDIGFNEVSFSRPLKALPNGACDFDGIDLDGSVMNGIVHDNFSHDNTGFGIFGWAGDGGGLTGWGPNTFSNNYSLNDGITAEGNLGYWGGNGFAVKRADVAATLTGNYFELTTSVSGVPMLAFSDTGSFGAGAMTNNIFVARDSNGLMMKCNGPNPMRAWVWKGNQWYGPRFTAGSNCNGNGPTTLAQWQAAVNGGDAGAVFLPASSAPPPPAKPVVGANNPANPNNAGMPFTGGAVIPPPPPPLGTGFAVTALTAPVTQPFTLSGTSGTAWVNIAAFDSAGNKVGPDTKPNNGKWSMVVTGLPLGSNALSVTAFSVPAGQLGGTTAAAPAMVTVTASPAPPVGLTVAQKAAMALVTADQLSVTTTLAASNAAIAKLQADLLAARKALSVP